MSEGAEEYEEVCLDLRPTTLGRKSPYVQTFTTAMLRFYVPSQFLSGNAARSTALLRGCPVDCKGKDRVLMKEFGLRAWPRATELILNIRRGLEPGMESLATLQQERPVAEPLKY